MIIPTKKPGTPQELALEHHGVLGMRWGHRKTITGGSGARRARKKFRKQNPTAFERKRTINTARGKVFNQKVQAHRTRDPAQAAKLHKTYLRNPDRATALRMTRGEKVVAAIVGGTLVGTTPVVAYGTGRVLYRHHVERKQARGGYG